MIAAAAPIGDLPALEHEVVDVVRRKGRRDARSAVGQRDDEIESLDGELQQHDRDRDEDRRDRRQDHLAIDARRARAVDLRRLDEVRIDRAQAGEKERHREAGRLPDAGGDDRIDRGVAIGDQAEGEIVPAEAAHQKFDARVGAIEPAPHRAGDDERDRERIEKDRPPYRFAAHALIDGDGERETDRERQDDIEGAEIEKIAVGDFPALVRPEIEIGLQADKSVGRQHRAVGHRNVERPQREAEHIDEARDRAGRDRQPRSPGSQFFAQGRLCVRMAWFALRAFDMGMRSTARQNRPRD